MDTSKITANLADNDKEKVSTIRVTTGAINLLRVTAGKLSSQVGQVLLTDQDRLLFLIKMAEANAKTVVQ